MRFTKSLIFLLLLFVGSLMSGVARASETAITHNGVTCYQQTGDTYPGDGHYFYCGANLNHRASLYAQVQSITFNSNYPSLGNALINGPVYWYIFKNCIDYDNYTSYPSVPTTTQLQNYYTSSVNKNGFTFPPSLGHTTIVYENIATGSYPTTTPNQTT
jgi:hypothetical protein